MKVLDTTFLIDLTLGDKDTLKIIKRKDLFLTTQINMYEFIRGLFLKGANKTYITKTMEVFENIRVISLNDMGIIKAAEISGKLTKMGKTISNGDCLTAGIALAHRVDTIVTRNTKHFKRIEGIKVESY